MTVICATCHVGNRDKAMFCRGCAGKLPAFAATGPSALEALRPARPRRGLAADAPDVRTREAAAGPVPAGSLRWRRAAIGLGALTLLLLAWIVFVPSHRVPVAASVSSPAAMLAPTAPSAAPALAPAPNALPVVQPATWPVEASLGPGESTAEPVAVSTKPNVQTVQAVPSAPTPSTAPAASAAPSTETPSPGAAPARTQAPTSGPVTTSRSVAVGVSGRLDPRAGCEKLFFVFAARCEANHCAQAAYAQHPRCDIVREQRRRDDARRNPTQGF